MPVLLAPLLSYATNCHLLAQSPSGCSSTQVGLSLGSVNGTFFHVGDFVSVSVGANVAPGQCQATNVALRLTFPGGTFFDVATNLTLEPGSRITCPNSFDPRCPPSTNGYGYRIKAIDLGKQTIERGLSNVFCFSPFTPKTAWIVASISGRSVTGPGPLTGFFSDCTVLPVTVFTPGLSCTLSCSNGVGPGDAIVYTGVATNSGDAPLILVAVSNSVNGGSFVLVTNIVELDPGVSVTFRGSYVPSNPYSANTNTVLVTGYDQLGSNLTATASAVCSNAMTASLVSPSRMRPSSRAMRQ
jgi:hypothetical protein